MSLLGKKWVILNSDDSLNIIAKLLKNRGIDSPEKAEWFFSGTLEHLHDPRLLKDIGNAVERIKKAIAGEEKIMVFGDYDVDGVTATAIVYDFLKKAGAKVDYALPNRDKNGYGLKDYFIRRFKEEGVGLIVTVDCGTSNFNEVELADELGMDVVVTDHHSTPEKLPPAHAVVNPQRPDCGYPNKEACGATVAYKLVTLLARDLWPEERAEAYLDHQLGIVALGVVGDCMALTGENRILVQEGLKRLADGRNPGVLALLEEAGISTGKITSVTIGFQIGPRLNAAGRLDDPQHAFELLIGNLEKAQTLNELNDQRRRMTHQCVQEAVKEIEKKDTVPHIIVLTNKKWQAGLLGLIANGVSEKFSRPTIIMREQDDEMIGSMRSVNNFDITTALRETTSDLFTAFGGHAMAGGFTMPRANLDEFLKQIEVIGQKQINPDEFVSTLNIDCEVKAEELSFETCHKFSRLEPFGAENPQPTLLVKNARILSIRPVGKGEHLHLPVRHGDKTVGGIAFRFGKHLDKIDPTKPHDIVFNLEINEWNGQKKLQMKVVDMKPSDVPSSQ